MKPTKRKSVLGHGVAIALFIATCISVDCPCCGQDTPFQDEYPRYAWDPGSMTLLRPFIAMGVDVSDATARIGRAWRAWRGVDPDLVEQWPDIAALHEENARWQEKWDATDPIDIIAFAFEQEGHGLFGSPRELAEQAWMRMHHLVPDSAIPTRDIWISERVTAGLEYGLHRMMTILSLSDEQVHAVGLAHEQFIELYRVFLGQLYDDFDEVRARLDERLLQDPVIRDPEGYKGYRRDRLRCDAFLATHGPGRRTSPAAYSGELQRELLSAWLEMQQRSEQVRRDGFRRFTEQVAGLLTDEQASRFVEAESAYKIGRIVYERQGAEITPILFASVRVDARLLLDPNIEPAYTMPSYVIKLRDAFAESPVSRELRAAIDTELARYEAAWLKDHAAAHKHKNDDQLAAFYRRLVNPGFHFLYRDQSDEQRDLRAFRDTLAMQTHLSELLTNHSTEIAAMWRDATNRLVYPEAYVRWDRIDITDEFDRAIAEATKDEVRQSLVELRETYQRERTAAEKELLHSTYAFARERLRNVVSHAFGPYRDLFQSRLTRRQWYRQQIALHSKL